MPHRIPPTRPTRLGLVLPAFLCALVASAPLAGQTTIKKKSVSSKDRPSNVDQQRSREIAARTAPGATAGQGLSKTAAAADTGALIVIDGAFEDWAEHDVAVFDDTLDAAGADVDFGAVRVAHDSKFVHFDIELGREVSLQKLSGSVHLLLDADGDETTGAVVHDTPGIDLDVMFTAPNERDPKKYGAGVGVQTFGKRGGSRRSPYEFGVSFAPTHSSPRYEIRIERDRRVLTGDSFAGRFVFLGREGEVLDTTDVFRHDLKVEVVRVTPGQRQNPLKRAAGTELRVMTWNARYGAILGEGSIARRIVDAVDPDVILIQEFTENNTAAEIEGLLNHEKIDKTRPPWKALVGGGGGDLRSAVASRFPMKRDERIEPIPYPNWDGRYIRTAAMELDVQGKRILVMSTHLKCCGRLGDKSDRKRETEAGGIRKAMLEVLQSGKYDGVIIAGDMNLVGGYRPLEILSSGLDVDGTNLSVVDAYQLDGTTTATWSDPEQPYVPGRLDYVLYADAGLAPVGSFVFESADLEESWLKDFRLRPGDTAQVSDHFPIVVDFGWSAAKVDAGLAQ